MNKHNVPNFPTKPFVLLFANTHLGSKTEKEKSQHRLVSDKNVCFFFIVTTSVFLIVSLYVSIGCSFFFFNFGNPTNRAERVLITAITRYADDPLF